MDQPALVLSFLVFLAVRCSSLAQRISPDQLLTSESSPSRPNNNRYGLQSEAYLPPTLWSEATNKKPARKPTMLERNPVELMEMMEKAGHWDSRFMRLSKRDRKALGRSSKSRRGAKKFKRPSVRNLWRDSKLQRKPRRWSQQTAAEASELLFSLANCSAEEQWVTLDRLFWPRQLLYTKCAGGGGGGSIGRGHAGGASQQSCGWPPGKLACRNVLFNVHILRWLCMPRASDVVHMRIRRTNSTNAAVDPIDQRFYCKWFEVPYTITKDCECGLPKNLHEEF